MNYDHNKFMLSCYTKNKGFTLIELLVVISIIGLLSSVVLASLNTARLKARISQRLSNMRQIQLALENYYDTNNSYPNPGWGWRSQCNAWGGFTATNVIPGLVPTYISSFPTDPSMDATGNKSCYLYLSNGTDYALLDHDVTELEGGAPNYASYPTFGDPTRDGGSNGCTVDASGYWSWKIASPGGTCW